MLALLLALLATAVAGPVHLLDLKGGVDPGSADYIVVAIENAEAAGAEALVLRLDTPGGLVTSARDIVAAELNSPVPIVVWVGPPGARAGSAGVFVTMAAHVAAMAPGTTIGAAHPVSLFGGGGGGGGEGEGGGDAEAMEAKILNDTAAWARTIAEQRGRNAQWAEDAVRQSVAVTEREAVELGVVDLVADDLDSLLDAIDGTVVDTADGTRTLRTAGATVVDVEWTVRQSVVHFLGDPNVLMALVALGMLGLYVEFNNPGMVVPGVLGVAMLLAAGIGLSAVPFNIGGLLLIVFAFAAFGLELYVGGHGIFALVGAIGLALGGILLFEVEGFDLRVDWTSLIVVTAVTAGVALGVGVLVAGAHRRKVSTGAEGLVGAAGKVTQGGAGGGWVRVEGEDWQARWTGTLEAGAPVAVVAVHGLELEVAARS